MKLVLLTALAVGGASVFGGLLGFAFKQISQKLSDIILSFAAGIMLCAAMMGLILPSLESGGKLSILITIGGIFCGSFCVHIIDKLVPHLHKITGVDNEQHPKNTEKLNKVLLFVIAIAIHNLPEGIAAGVGFGTGDTTAAFTIAIGIAIQNIPEGLVIISPMLACGMSKKRTFLVALITGFVEVLGTFIGYFATLISTAILPFALAFAGGTMLYVISDEMIPETHSHNNETEATYSLLVGFCLMLLFDFLLD